MPSFTLQDIYNATSAICVVLALIVTILALVVSIRSHRQVSSLCDLNFNSST